jgi:cell division protein FtsB
VGIAMMKARRIRYITLLVMLAVVGIAFAAANNHIQSSILNISKQESQNRIQLSDIQKEKLSLEAELSVAGTDAYIENEARTRYGYLKPGELRFVITNPEALYSGGGEAPNLQVVQEGDKP